MSEYGVCLFMGFLVGIFVGIQIEKLRESEE